MLGDDATTATPRGSAMLRLTARSAIACSASAASCVPSLKLGGSERYTGGRHRQCAPASRSG